MSAVCRLRCCHEPKERVECDTIRLSDQVAVDISPGGHVVAIEVLDASELIRRASTFNTERIDHIYRDLGAVGALHFEQYTWDGSGALALKLWARVGSLES